MNFIIQISSPDLRDTIRKNTIAEADKIYENKLKYVRRSGGAISLVHSSDLQNPISQMTVPEPLEEEEEEDPYEF